MVCARRPRSECIRVVGNRTSVINACAASSTENVEDEVPASNVTEPENDVVETVGLGGPGGVDASSDDFFIAPEQDYVEVKRNAQKDNDEQSDTSAADGPIDLFELDGAGRKVLDSGSYASIVDVNIEAGGLLGVEDEDNSELFTGVDMSALLESEQLTQNLRKEFAITTATHVQLAAIPRIQQGDNVVVQSHTGTGKTLAFLLPLLESMDAEFPHIQAIVVAPTRELAMQIYGECTRLCAGTSVLSMALIGGANPARQIEKLRKRSPHVVIGTPGRLAELEDQRALHVKKVRMLVIDEVDHSLQENFLGSIERLMRRIPKSRQLVLVSATGDVDNVREFATKEMNDSLLLRVGDKQLVPKNISNWYAVVPPRLRIETLRKLMNAEPVPQRAICFVNDPRRVDLVLERLYKMKIPAAALRGSAHKLERAEVIKAFRTGAVRLLVTTEIAARGLDVREVTHVFNLDLPTDADHYVHRAGRCGRAGAEGVVVSIAVPETAFVINRLEKRLGLKITRMEPRDGRYSEPVDHTPQIDLRAIQQYGSRKEGKPGSSGSTGGRADGKKGKKAKKNLPDVEMAEGEKGRKPHAKKRHTKAMKSRPKVRVSSRDISIHAKKKGWVGNRSPSTQKRSNGT